MNIIFYGGRQAGMIALLAIIAKKHDVKYVIPEDDIIGDLAKNLCIPTIDKSKINDEEIREIFLKNNIDLFVCCHGRKIIKEPIMNLRSELNLKCINIHPCLYKYQGTTPIDRMIADNNKKGSVAVHWMTEEVDGGEVIVELFKEVELDSVVSVYNQLYPLYAAAIIKALEELE